MARTMDAIRVALALCVAACAAGFPPLRVAVLDWIAAADLLPKTAAPLDEGGQLWTKHRINSAADQRTRPAGA